ncbi:MAG: hypothetical protein JNM36_13015 [Chitinophagales bacterium]|nr:hypothetical protein [Chitinophagales bacterium]
MSTGAYRFGYQGQEQDNKMGGLGQHTTAQFWEYDTWAVKRWNVDPKGFAWESPYATFRNNPIIYKDPNGDIPLLALLAKGATGAAVDATIQFLVNVVVYDGDYTAALQNIDYKSVAWEVILSMNPLHLSKGQRLGLDIVGDLGINYLNGKYDNLEGDALSEQLFYDAIQSGATTLISEKLGSAGMNKLSSFLQKKGWHKYDIFKATGVRMREQADIRVGDKEASRAMPWRGRKIGKNVNQNTAVQARAAQVNAMGAKDIRIDQTQVNASGKQVGINRPDLQYTLNGKRYYEEWDTPSSGRGPEHEFRIKANDPEAGEVKLRILK